MKYEWKEHEKEFYGINKLPSIITVPKQNFIHLSGKGNADHADFAERVEVLYSLAYAIKNQYKTHANNLEQNEQLAYHDYTIFPLEGLWTSVSNSPMDKNTFNYALMIKQPDVITHEMFEKALSVVEQKKPHPFLNEVTFGSIEDGLCVQLLHVGPFDDESASFDIMDEFSKANGLTRISDVHREIYLTNAKRSIPSKYRTILRYQVKKDSDHVK